MVMKKESDLYKPVKDLLENAGYEVYAEVEPRRTYGSGRADVVGYNKPAVCIVEMKTSLSMDLIEQAYKWLPHAHYIYIAIPERKRGVPEFVKKILKSFGIGIIEVHKGYTTKAYITVPARFNRPRTPLDWDKELLPEHQTWVEGGTSGGGYVTDYSLTINKVKTFMSILPMKWFSINEILDHCETHYASPKSSLSKALKEFETDWCETKKRKGRLWYRMKQ